MLKAVMAHRFGRAVTSIATWTVSAVAVLWFYDWVDRWYVVVPALLGLVLVASRLTFHERSALDDTSA